MFESFDGADPAPEVAAPSRLDDVEALEFDAAAAEAACAALFDESHLRVVLESAEAELRAEIADDARAWNTSAPVDTMTPDEALDAAVAIREQQARDEARVMDLLARAAGTATVREVIVEAPDTDAEGRARAVRMVDEVLDELAAALRLSPASVYHQVQRARLLTGPLAGTRKSLAAGRISPAHAGVIAEQAARMLTGPLGDDTVADEVFAQACASLEDRVLPVAERSTAGATRSRASRVVALIDAAGDAERRRRAKKSRDITARGLDDGLAQVSAILDATDAAWVHTLVDQLARDAIADGTVTDLDLGCDATLGEVRAAMFLRLLRGHTETSAAARAVVGVQVQVVVDAATLTGLDVDGSALVQVGHGAPTPVARDDLIRLITDPGTPTRFRRLVCDPLTGALVDRGARTYAVSDDLAAWITARDVTCRFPGCTRRARSCDIDHATDFDDGGETTVQNTGALCRRHHNAKTHGRWRIENSRPDGTCEFISPAGRRHLHHPEPLILPPAPEPEPPPPPARAVVPDDEPPPF